MYLFKEKGRNRIGREKKVEKTLERRYRGRSKPLRG